MSMTTNITATLAHDHQHRMQHEADVRRLVRDAKGRRRRREAERALPLTATNTLLPQTA